MVAPVFTQCCEVNVRTSELSDPSNSLPNFLGAKRKAGGHCLMWERAMSSRETLLEHLRLLVWFVHLWAAGWRFQDHRVLS